MSDPLYGENTILPILLPISVEQRIHEIIQRGGVHERDIQRVKAYGDIIAEHGDDLLYKSKKPGETARYFNQLADAVSVLAFQPGGITVFGQHYEAKNE
jgi:hypothetical protein